jgi:hypothetical protein
MSLPPLSQLSVRGEAPVGKPFKIFDTAVSGAGFQTGVYVYALDPQGVAHFGFGRKVPPGRRTPFRAPKGSAAKTGAAGTDAKYQGKWVSLGGGSDSKSSHPLDGALIELSDEAFFVEQLPGRVNSTDVYVPWLGGGTPSLHKRLRLLLADQANPNTQRYTFCFEMKYADFIRLFPNVDDLQNMRGGQAMVDASHGEIDWCASFTVEQIIHYQRAAVLANGDNYFTGYTLRTLTGPVFEALHKVRQPHNKKQLADYYKLQGKIILSLIRPDKMPRTPNGKRDQVMYK